MRRQVLVRTAVSVRTQTALTRFVLGMQCRIKTFLLSKLRRLISNHGTCVIAGLLILPLSMAERRSLLVQAE